MKALISVSDKTGVVELAQALHGLGVGLLPLHAANMMAKTLGLAVRPLEEDWAQRRMLVCVKKERANSHAVAKLLAYLAKGRLPV